MIVQNPNKIAEQAITAIKAVGNNFLRMKRDDVTIDFPFIQNLWLPIPEEMASKGVLSTLIVPPESNPRVSIVFIPKYGEVKTHYHEKEVETFTVIHGQVNYKLFATDNHKTLLMKGTLKEGDSVEVEPLQSHYVFTTEVDAYLKITFLTNNT